MIGKEKLWIYTGAAAEPEITSSLIFTKERSLGKQNRCGLTQLCLLLEMLEQQGAHLRGKKVGGKGKKRKGRNGERKGKKKGKEGMGREGKRKGKGTSRFLKVSLPLTFLPLNHFKCSENAPEFLAM